MTHTFHGGSEAKQIRGPAWDSSAPILLQRVSKRRARPEILARPSGIARTITLPGTVYLGLSMM